MTFSEVNPLDSKDIVIDFCLFKDLVVNKNFKVEVAKEQFFFNQNSSNGRRERNREGEREKRGGNFAGFVFGIKEIIVTGIRKINLDMALDS